MRLPSEYYIRYLTYTSRTPDEVIRLLKEKLLIKELNTNEIALRQSRFVQLLNHLASTCTDLDQILISAGIKELSDYFTAIQNNTPADPDMTAAFGVLTYIPVRRVVDQSIITGLSFDDIAVYVNKEHGLPITKRGVELYSKYFWAKLSRQEWFWFLSSNDIFGYTNLISNPEDEQIFKLKTSNNSYEKTEYDLIARKSFEHLREKIDSEDADPDVCGKWFKLFEASRSKSNVPFLLGNHSNKESSDKYELGFPEQKKYKIKSIDDFVAVKPDDDKTVQTK